MFFVGTPHILAMCGKAYKLIQGYFVLIQFYTYKMPIKMVNLYIFRYYANYILYDHDSFSPLTLEDLYVIYS